MGMEEVVVAGEDNLDHVLEIETEIEIDIVVKIKIEIEIEKAGGDRIVILNDLNIESFI